jgi:hypothetical protein
MGDTTIVSGTFTVVAPVPPSITNVAVVEVGTTSTDNLDPGTPLKITWKASSQHGIATQVLKIDGHVKTSIKGSSETNYRCAIGKYKAGTHTYKIKVTDSKGVSYVLTGTFTVGSTLMVEASASTQGSAESLGESSLAPIVAEAISRWEAVLGTQLDTILADVTVKVGDLSGNILGETQGKTIWIDRDAAGYGWFVDATPSDDVEFLASGLSSLIAQKNSDADLRADLLTVVMHEIGHILGYSDTAADDLMDSMLPLGTRRDVSSLITS